MSGWTEGLARAIAYLEAHLTEDLDPQILAAQAYVSPFYFQKIFHVLCGMTLGEYIRGRRLTLAAQELSVGSARVMDLALKYGYDSPDSFARAFTRFHGISPSAAREKGVSLRALAPLQIKVTLEGGTMLEYRIEEKDAFTVMGKLARFDCETSYQEIPRFWDAHYQSGGGKIVCGAFGLCLDGDGRSFDYMIADLYTPWKPVPQGYVTRIIPGGTWAVFPCRGPLPRTLQSVNTAIWSQWLPALKGYRLRGSYNVEMYAPPAEDPADTYSEIWIPLEKC